MWRGWGCVFWLVPGGMGAGECDRGVWEWRKRREVGG